MILKINFEKYIFLILVLIMGVWFYLLNCSIPLIGDDMAYGFYYDEHSLVERPTSIPISSISQVLPSMWNHYCTVNGRFTSHVLIQIFCGLTGKAVFNVVNSMMFMLFITYLVKTICRRLSLIVLSLSFLFVLYGISFPGQTMFWLAGSINYMWPLTLSLCMLYYIMDYKKNVINYICCFMLFFAGVFIGWMNESISIGFAGGLFFYFIINKKRFSGYPAVLYLGYILGTALIIFSPGTITRATTSGEIITNLSIIQMITMRIVVFVQMMLKLPVILFAFLILTYFVIKNKSVLLEMPSPYIFIISATFMWLIGIDDERMYFTLSVVSFVLLVQLLKTFIAFTVNNQVYVVMVLSLLLLSVPQTIKAYNEITDYANYKDTVEKAIIRAPEDGVFMAPKSPKPSRFVYAMETSSDRLGFHNRVMSFVYGKTFIQSLPRDLYMQYIKTSFVEGLKSIPFNSDTTIVKGIYTVGNKFIIPINRNHVTHRPQKCLVQYENKDENLYKHQIAIRWLLGSLGRNTEERSCFYVKHSDSIYYVLPYDGKEVNIQLPIEDGNSSGYVKIKM